MANFTPDETTKLQAYMRRIFKNDTITLKGREKAMDSQEVLIDGEFIGVVYKDTDEGETSFDFNMAILGEDI